MNPRSLLITGANRGLGLELVKQFLRLPSPPKWLFATCRDPSKAQELGDIAKQHGNVTILELDVKDETAIRACAQSVGASLNGEGLNLLINNAGIAFTTAMEDTTMQPLVENFHVNAASPFIISQAFLPLLKIAAKKNPGSLSCSKAAIINVSSYLGSVSETCGVRGGWGWYPYRASKAALNMLTRTMSIDLEPDRVMVAALHPGWVKTDMGGVNAELDIGESISSVMKTLASFSNEQNGLLINYDGSVIPW